MRTSKVEVGTPQYNFDCSSVYQCTWYSYFRNTESDVNLPYPCWWDRETQTGSYTNAKDWLANYRDPWQVKDVDYHPVEHDIVVFDGEYGHVAFIEKVNGDTALLSQYMSGDPNSFSNYSWKIGTNYTGKLLGYLHCPVKSVSPVPRNTEVDQIEATDESLRIRLEPSLSGEIVGHIKKGYYNVLKKKEATIEEKQSQIEYWYEIEPDRWCANITTIYLPSGEEEDIVKLIKEYAEKMQKCIKVLEDQNKEYKERLVKIHDLSEV